MKVPKVATLIFLCFTGLKAYPQKHEALVKQFYTSIINTSIITGRPLATTIKVDISKTGAIGKVELADSTDWAFKKVFNYRMKDLDWNALKKYVKINGWKSLTLLIPYYVYNASEGDNKQRGSLMIQFNDKSFSGKNIILKPIEIYYLSEV